jgi:hypothetical protein
MSALFVPVSPVSDDVRARRYPGTEHTVFMKEDELARFKQMVAASRRRAAG